LLNFVGSATGLEVARTIGKGIVNPEIITYGVIIAALATNIIWSMTALHYGLPTSETHGLVASLAGGALATAGSQAVNWSVILRIIMWVIITPLLSFITGYVVMVAIYWLFQHSQPDRVRRIFNNLQIASAGYMAYSHGLNDGHMPVGIITMALVLHTGQVNLWDNIPLWVILTSAIAISTGTALGGWRIIRTLGAKVTALRPVHGFAAETSGALVIQIASLFGMPVSTTQGISAAIMGVGATKRLSAVRWGVARAIFAAWVLTFPICGVLGYLLARLLHLVF
jgi:PiT family inorganic phosphate transporter